MLPLTFPSKIIVTRQFTCIWRFCSKLTVFIFMPCSVSAQPRVYQHAVVCCVSSGTAPAVAAVRLTVALFAAFLNMLCSLKWGIYVFFGAWQFIGIFFTLFLVPETRGVPIEEVCVPLLYLVHIVLLHHLAILIVLYWQGGNVTFSRCGACIDTEQM